MRSLQLLRVTHYAALLNAFIHTIMYMTLECKAARLICGDVFKNKMDFLKTLSLETDEEGVSDIERMDREVNFYVGWVFIQYEGGKEHCYEAGLIARFNLYWLLEGKMTGDGHVPEWLI